MRRDYLGGPNHRWEDHIKINLEEKGLIWLRTWYGGGGVESCVNTVMYF
jgi:hypothetical protein